MRLKFLFLCLLIQASLAHATARADVQPTVHVDEKIKLFIKQDSSAAKRVLVRYNYSKALGLFANPVEFQKNKIRHTVSLQNQFFASNSSARTLWLVNATIVDLTGREIKTLLSKNEIKSITSLGRKARIVPSFEPAFRTRASFGAFTDGLEKIRIPELTKLYPNATGAGTRVGIIDTGIDAQHPDLVGRLLAYRDFVSPGNKVPRDDHGHGTHVAGTIAGGHSSGRAIGVAPEAGLVVAKAFSSTGGSLDSDLLESLQWMADPDQNPNTPDQPNIVSNSWNLDDAEFGKMNPMDDVFCVAIDNLIALGITPIFAAGNDGSSAGSIKLPAACPNALSVGGTDSDDEILSYSSRGPVKWKSATFTKPEISAPGEYVLSAEPGGGYRMRSGTSMAAPHVAGLVALMYQAKPGVSVADVRAALFAGALDLGAKGQDNVFGFGRADAVDTFNFLRNLP